MHGLLSNLGLRLIKVNDSKPPTPKGEYLQGRKMKTGAINVV